MELIKKAVKVGNSAGVILPKEFLNLNVKVVLQPLNIGGDIIKILSERGLLKNVIGVYLVGSYARKEESVESDIDVLVITDNINDHIEKEKYDLMLVSKDLVDEKMQKNIFPLLPMMIEAKPIINQELLKEYIKTPLSWKNIQWHIDTTKSAMKMVKAYIELAEATDKNVHDVASYSLILRLRTIYLVNCLKSGKKWSKKEFLKIIKKITGSLKAYEGYLHRKNKTKEGNTLPIDEAIKLMDHNNKKIREIEKCLKKRKKQGKKD